MQLFAVLLGICGILISISEVLLQNSELGIKPRRRLYLKYYYSGILYVLAVTELLKLFFSKLRPHFLDSCVPDMSSIKCSDGYITSFNCTGKGPRWLIERDIYKSFPSGHSSLSCYAFVFIAIYIYSKAEHCKKTPLCTWWIRCIPLLSLIWTIVCCISRILDNRHFLQDVLTGLFIGVIGGLITVKICLKRASQAPLEKTSK
ncbi:Lipid phosphate phosphohydrolase 1, partial [Stegodyphus mimosarum]